MEAASKKIHTAIKKHLKQHSIFKDRATSINNAFASAVAPNDVYDKQKVNEILVLLDCVKDGKCFCVYCGKNEAKTWDHVFPLVEKGAWSKYGHTYGNLVPCCKDCNSAKGSHSWKEANMKINKGNKTQLHKVSKVMSRYLKKYNTGIKLTINNKKEKELRDIQQRIFVLMKKADRLIGDAK